MCDGVKKRKRIHRLLFSLLARSLVGQCLLFSQLIANCLRFIFNPHFFSSLSLFSFSFYSFFCFFREVYFIFFLVFHLVWPLFFFWRERKREREKKVIVCDVKLSPVLSLHHQSTLTFWRRRGERMKVVRQVRGRKDFDFRCGEPSVFMTTLLLQWLLYNMRERDGGKSEQNTQTHTFSISWESVRLTYVLWSWALLSFLPLSLSLSLPLFLRINGPNVLNTREKGKSAFFGKSNIDHDPQSFSGAVWLSYWTNQDRRQERSWLCPVLLFLCPVLYFAMAHGHKFRQMVTTCSSFHFFSPLSFPST